MSDEIQKWEDRINDAVTVYVSGGQTPRQLRDAAQKVLEFYADKYVTDGEVRVLIEDGNVATVSLVDTAALRALDAEIASDLEQVILEAVREAGEEAQAALTEAEQTHTGAIDPTAQLGYN